MHGSAHWLPYNHALNVDLFSPGLNVTSSNRLSFAPWLEGLPVLSGSCGEFVSPADQTPDSALHPQHLVCVFLNALSLNLPQSCLVSADLRQAVHSL